MLNYHRERFRKLTTVSLETRNPSLNLRGKYWRQFCDRIRKYPDSTVHTYPKCYRIQKFPLWRADSKVSGFACEFAVSEMLSDSKISTLESGFKSFRICLRIRRMRVDDSRIRKEKVADSKISGYVWTGPK